MNMTHYMSLLSQNQPWNLIIFMAIPVICAETLTISEFFIIFNRVQRGGLKTLNKIVGIFAGIYFTGIFIYLMLTAVIPLTSTGGWHTWVDIVAVGFYLSGVIFLLPIGLMELGLIFRNKTADEKMKIHFMLVGGFLVVAHIAMIFGMVNPEIIGKMSNMAM
ncbi:permease [Clostridium acetobutylicum]|nr:permease [Clostridium acetobutylicum]